MFVPVQNWARLALVLFLKADTSSNSWHLQVSTVAVTIYAISTGFENKTKPVWPSLLNLLVPKRAIQVCTISCILGLLRQLVRNSLKIKTMKEPVATTWTHPHTTCCNLEHSPSASI